MQREGGSKTVGDKADRVRDTAGQLFSKNSTCIRMPWEYLLIMQSCGTQPGPPESKFLNVDLRSCTLNDHPRCCEHGKTKNQWSKVWDGKTCQHLPVLHEAPCVQSLSRERLEVTQSGTST